ncbi:MAG: DUF2934 domain-containing protein [Phycisphaeraceae bacterium]|nr:DUF2934 domain-containing protein [Phycisphaeraceae bacterium]
MSTMAAPASATVKKSSTTAAPKDCHPATPSAGISVEVTVDHIRARAYEIYQARNGSGGPGDEASDWAQAERELNGSGPEPSLAHDLEIKAQARGEQMPACDR